MVIKVNNQNVYDCVANQISITSKQKKCFQLFQLNVAIQIDVPVSNNRKREIKDRKRSVSRHREKNGMEQYDANGMGRVVRTS